MRRNPLYAFRDRDATGIYNVPLNSTIHILNRGDGTPIFVEIIAKTGLTAGSTIGQFLDDETLYVDLGQADVIPSELEKIQEDSKIGWRMFGRVPANYGDIGQGAIDFSQSTEATDANGATGSDSFAAGTNTTATAMSATALGTGTISDVTGGTAIGRYNLDNTQTGYNPDNVFTVGVGSANYDRKNGLVVHADGVVRAPELDINEITNGTDDTLVTKEYADDIDGGSI